MLLATVYAKRKRLDVDNNVIQHLVFKLFSEDFVNCDRIVPQTVQDVHNYVFSIPGIVEAKIVCSDAIIKN